MKKLITIWISLMSLFGYAKDSSSEIDSFLSKNQNVLVHVHASWCPSCKVQKKILNEIKNKNFVLKEINFDKDKKFLKKNKVFKQSMLISFVNGKEVGRKYGITKKEKIMDFIKTSFPDSLQDKINQKRSKSKVPQAARMTMIEATEELRKTGIIDKALKKGDQFIDFTLLNVKGEKVTLSEKLKNGPIILTFYRGGWCPYCNLQLKAYQEKLDDFNRAGGQLIAISPESMESGNTTVKKNDLKFEILTDNLNKQARKYGLVFKLSEKLKEVYLKFGLDLEKNQGNDTWELPIPATYVIDKSGKIVYSFLNVDYIQRAEPQEIIKVLEELKN